MPLRRGRLTDQERDRLAAALIEAEDRLELPEGADRWSTWGQGEVGPEPYPSWVITSEAAVDTRLGVVKTGKEAEVHLVERWVPGKRREVGKRGEVGAGAEVEAGAAGGGQRVLLAEKQYRSADHRLFHRDAGYLEGRRTRESRLDRAIANRTTFGRKLIAEQWAAAEFAALCGLWAAGAPVPYPVSRLGTDLMLEFIGDADGGAAPRLAQLRPSTEQLVDLWEQLTDGLATLARAGFTHGDLSAYNVLVHNERLVLIDLPQVVDVVVNPRGAELLARDVRNIGGWFATRGLPQADWRVDGLLRLLRDEAGIGESKDV
ncbi:MAG TPA: RIO1 family regulatory kinase/ATPase [Chloroflexota bacterium]|nr:RIO1 family regulatory kinase/ATPase [Chloroflexota bacterium]